MLRFDGQDCSILQGLKNRDSVINAMSFCVNG